MNLDDGTGFIDSGIRGSEDMTVLPRFDVTGTFGIEGTAFLRIATETLGNLRRH